MGRRRVLALWGAVVAAEAASFAPRSAWADAVDKLVGDLGNAPSYKVRVQAAALLSRMKDPRALQAVGRAAVFDAHPSVRMMAIRVLGKNPGGDSQSAHQAYLALARAVKDRDPNVRKAAAQAMTDLDRAVAPQTQATTAYPRTAARRPQTLVAIGQMGDRTGRTSRAFRDRMRLVVRKFLGQDGAVQVTESLGPGMGFLVDGSVIKLDFKTGRENVEAICAVELVVSRPPRGITTVASGEAIVQKPTTQYRPQMREILQEEALEHAVRGAHENLAKFLANQN